MKNIQQLRKTFVRQLGASDCGPACLSMILKYAGREKEALVLKGRITNSELSLFDLRNLAQEAGLQARCVVMDLDFLSVHRKPCILHLQDEHGGHHFQVCYGSDQSNRNKGYLMGDPARGITYIAARKLEQSWRSRAALYIDGLPEEPVRQRGSTLHQLLLRSLIPKGLLISIPLLHVFTAILGICLSWALQRGMEHSIAGEQQHLIEGIVALLFIVTLARNLLIYLRQQLMIRINTGVNRHLMSHLIFRVMKGKAEKEQYADSHYFKNGISGLMKMQQAISAFLVSILSDGFTLVLLLAILCYQSVVAGLINMLYLIVILCYTVRRLPGYSLDHAHLNELSGSGEKMILMEMDDQHPKLAPELERAYAFHLDNHNRYLEHAGKVSSGISGNNLVQECLGTVNVIVIFINGIYNLRDESLDYRSFMAIVIISYLITSLMPKICSNLFVVNEGIEASRDYPADPAL